MPKIRTTAPAGTSTISDPIAQFSTRKQYESEPAEWNRYGRFWLETKRGAGLPRLPSPAERPCLPSSQDNSLGESYIKTQPIRWFRLFFCLGRKTYPVDTSAVASVNLLYACFCRAVEMGEEGVTLRGINDTLDVVGPEPAGQPFAINVTLALGFAPIAAGQFKVAVRVRDPRGLKRELSELAAGASPSMRYVHTHVALKMRIDVEGTHVFGIAIDGSVRTEIPLNIHHRQSSLEN